MLHKLQQDRIITASVHRTVLLKESIEGLNLKDNSIFFDGTLGGGGHSEKVCQDFKGVHIIAVDQDTSAIERAKIRLGKYQCHKDFIESNFRDIDLVLQNLGIKEVDGILFDLGLSSDQFEISGRGFSFKFNEPLHMNFSVSNESITAERIVNEWSEQTLADIFYGYADERYAKRISKKIVEERLKKPIKTTFDLVEIIRQSVPVSYTRQKIHFATKTFQALRIAVNDEIESLKEGLEKGYKFLKGGGRIAIISFHSTEDRVVKNFFKLKKEKKEGTLVNKKPIIPSPEEILLNPRSRSAKLRILEKIK